MKKIICLIEDLCSGGAERQLTGLAVLLKEQGYNVEVWCYYPNDFYLKNLIDGGVVYRYLPEAQSKKKRISVITRELKKADPDTVIAFLDTACIVACIVKLLGAKFKLIVSERNTTQKLTMRERVKFFFYRFADCVVPNSQTQTDFIAKHYPSLKKKLKCITNFVDTEKFVPNENKVTNDSVRILTAARVMPQKNVINYIKAIKCVVEKGYNVTVDWYGASYNQTYMDLCKQTIADNNLNGIFNLHPASKNIIKEYQTSDVFCLPSLYEGYPNVVCEAMSCGLPILCSNVCDNSNIVIDGVNGFIFEPLSLNQMADKIIMFLILTKAEKEKMCAYSRDIVTNKCSKLEFVKKYEDII